jgi:alkyl sulfatase BDS1-like metallo-beta-lactamase superfamily hydrolase
MNLSALRMSLRYVHSHAQQFVIGAVVSAGLLASAAALTFDGPPGRDYPEEPVFDNPKDLFEWGKDQKKALRVHDAIYQAIGFGNSFMVVTRAGNVVVDTSAATHASRHKKLLQAEDAGPVRYIVLTHGHADHTGGMQLWKEPGTQIVAQAQHVEFMNYQKRLEGFFARRNAAQFARPVAKVGPWAGNYGATIEPTILFDDHYSFEVGGLKFEAFHTPGETDDHLTLWIPEYKAAFIGDNFYRSFPNIYTLRGTQPRKGLDYVRSLDRVLALRPEILLPSHGLPVHGNAEIAKVLTRYRDAISYVHDAVVQGMNAGKDVFTLMREIHLPRELECGENYGRLTWSIRGIYEGYAGWFDLDPATMYEEPPAAIYPELARLAGGPSVLVERARERIKANRPVDALHLTGVALAADPKDPKTLEARLTALEALKADCRNIIERGWLDSAITRTQECLYQARPAGR